MNRMFFLLLFFFKEGTIAIFIFSVIKDESQLGVREIVFEYGNKGIQ